MLALPESPKRISTSSFGLPPAPAGSTNMVRPMPRSLPLRFDSARRDSKFAQREGFAVAVERELAGELGGAAVVIAHRGLGARGDPFHRFAERARGVHQRAVLGVGVRADAEAAADVVRVHADLLARHASDRG